MLARHAVLEAEHKDTERMAFASWKSAFVQGHASAENWARMAQKLDTINFDIASDSDDELDFGSDSGELLNTTGSSESDRIGRTTTHDNVETKNILIADTDDEWEIATESSLLMDEDDMVEADSENERFA